jgi:hypothetical protein
MKLPSKSHEKDTYNDELFDACQKAAIRLTLQSGIIVKAVMVPIEPPDGWPAFMATFPTSFSQPLPELEYEIVFKTMGNRYGSLKEVRKALKMKAFQ